jgi:hypothetical protein
MGMFDPLMDYIKKLESRISKLECVTVQHEESILALQDGLYPLERKSQKFCDDDIHKWEYGISHTKCSVCDVFCDCNMKPGFSFVGGIHGINECIHCKRQTLA